MREPASFLAVEHGECQAEDVERLMREAGYATVEHVRDLAGIERVAVARR